jgi:nitrite reductase (NO-forming)
MPTPAPTAPDCVAHPTTRRDFLVRASALLAAAPIAEATLAACAPSQPEHHQTGTGTPPDTTTRSAVHLQNPDSRLDTSLRTGNAPPASGALATAAPPEVPFHRYDPTLPPLSAGRTKHIAMTIREAPIRINADTVVAGWTFDGTIPGPIVHVRQEDTVEFTLTNHGSIPHSMDFHASRIDPKTAFRSVLPGQSISYTFTPRYAGAFLYHCGTAPVLMHIGSGMFGAIIVDPPTPLAPAREFVLIQNEFYLTPPQSGIAAFDYSKMLSTLPDYVAFNGGPGQYQNEPIRVRRHERVRFYVVSAGPTHSCAFHVVGQQFDTVYLGAPPGNAIHGVQTFDVAAGGGMVFELQADVAGEFPFVNHAFGHGQKGAIGVLVVES